MKINGDQLQQAFKKSQSHIVVLTGNEPLLLQEAFDASLAYAKTKGFIDREIFDVGAGFDWSEFSYNTNAPSLFSDKRILDVRLSSLKIGEPGSKALQTYIENQSPDNFLILTTPKLDGNAQKSKWFVALEKKSLVATIWPIDRSRLPDWVAARLKAAELPYSAKISSYIAAQTEGNLIAAMQHIEKLSLLKTDKPMDERTMAAAITSANHYTVFDLVSSALLGETARAIRIVRALKAEKIELTLALWAICAELRIADYLLQHSGQKPFAQLCRDKGVWQKRQDDLNQFIKRQKTKSIHAQLQLAARIDAMIKGIKPGNAWEEIESLVLFMSDPKGVPCHV